jgi:hypothetical protein
MAQTSRSARTNAAKDDGSAPRNTTPSGKVTLNSVAVVDGGGVVGKRSSTKRGDGAASGATAAP